MTIREVRRAAAVERMADHLLREGFAGASLRPLAAAAGTSDRMLLYYFDSKDELLAATLERVAERMAQMLDAALPPGVRLPFSALLGAVWAASASDALRPFMRIWLELAAAAGGGQTTHEAVASRIADRFVSWACDHLELRPEEHPEDQAALLLATVDGLLLLDAVGRRDLADRAVAALGVDESGGAPVG